MSHNSLWYSDDQLAGPSKTSTPLSFDSPKLPYKIGIPVHQQSLSQTPFNEYSIPQILQKKPRSHCVGTKADGQHIFSQFKFPDCEDEAMTWMVQFYNRFRSEVYGGDHHSSTSLTGNSNSPSAEDFDADLLGMPNYHFTMQHDELHGFFRHNTCAIQSPLYPQQDIPSMPSSQPLTPPESSKSPGSLCMTTPKLRETANLLTSDVHGRSQTLSPYAPMPLQPIFPLEPQSKTMHDPTELVPHPPQHTDNAFPIDPLLTSCSHAGDEEAGDAAWVPFARGSTAPGYVWPPSSFVPGLPMPMYQKLCLPPTTGIPLEIAKQYARDCRAATPHSQLSQQFLLTFMGQSVGQLPWLCYIRGCGKQLTRKSHMVDHIRMHLDERVYACEYCPQTFLRKADCKRHSAAHNPEKAFQCDLCIKSFGRKDLLTRHKRKCEINFNQRGASNTKGLVRRRKGLRGHGHYSSLNTPDRGTPNLIPIAGDLSPDRFENFKSDNSEHVLESDGTNKENIPPFLLPSGMIFTSTTMEARIKTKTRALH